MSQYSRSRHQVVAGRALVVTAAAALMATGLGAPTAVAAPESRQAAARDHARAALASHGPAVRESADDAFTARGQAVLDKDGSAHVHYDRTYQGLPVLGGDVVVHLADDGSYDGASLSLQRPLQVATGSKISRADAVAAATRPFDGTVSSTEARRVVDALGSTPASAWEVTVQGTRTDGTPSVLHVVVDAGSGAVRRSADEIKTGTGNSMYSGQVAIGTGGSAGHVHAVATRRAAGTTPPTFAARPPAPAPPSPTRTTSGATARPATVPRPASTPTTARRSPGTSTRTSSAATASSTTAPVSARGCTTATPTTTPSGTAPR